MVVVGGGIVVVVAAEGYAADSFSDQQSRIQLYQLYCCYHGNC